MLRDRTGVEIDVCPLTEDGRLITDPGQDMRAPEERPTIHQAFPEISADEAAASEGLATERREERPQ